MEELKTWPESFQAIWDGLKTYEVRKADREFKLWNVVWLREYDPNKKKYTGREMAANITYITNWIDSVSMFPFLTHVPEFVVFGLKVYQKIDKSDVSSKAPKL